jgi:hypothetical protein
VATPTRISPPGKVTAYPAEKAAREVDAAVAPCDGRMAPYFEPVRRSRASMTVGQTSIS